MKLAFLFWGITLLLSPSLQAQPFVQGQHYDVIATSASSQPQVVVYFSYFCGACAAIEPFVQRYRQQLPEDTRFRKVMWYMGNANPEAQQALELGFITAEHAGFGNAFSDKVYQHIHQRRLPLRNAADVRAIAISAGMDEETFDARVRSFSTRAASNAMRQEQRELSEQRLVSAVPTFVVHGKFRVNNSGLNPRNYQQELEQLLNYLLSKAD